MVTVSVAARRAGRRVDWLDAAVHVFVTELDTPAAERHQLAALLSADERERARRFRFDRDRNRFIVARGLLRTILGHYLDTAPRAIRFRYALGGKPAVDAGLTFNLSHADRLALIAVARDGRIGVDVERMRDEIETTDLEPHCLAPSEIATLVRLEPTARRRAFFQCWTRKESYLKAVGVGLAIPLQAVAVEPRTDMSGVSRVVSGNAAAGWVVHDLTVPVGYAAAIALDTTRPIVTRRWTNGCRDMDPIEDRDVPA